MVDNLVVFLINLLADAANVKPHSPCNVTEVSMVPKLQPVHHSVHLVASCRRLRDLWQFLFQL